MKTFAWLFVFLTLGCHKSSEITPIEPSLLIGTWESNSTTTSLPIRWTFDANHLYLSNEIVISCQPVQTQPWEYRIKKNVLVTHYVGASNGLPPLPDSHFSIVSITEQQMTLSILGSSLELAKCN